MLKIKIWAHSEVIFSNFQFKLTKLKHFIVFLLERLAFLCLIASITTVLANGSSYTVSIAQVIEISFKFNYLTPEIIIFFLIHTGNN